MRAVVAEAEDTLVPAAAPILVELVAATAELGSVDQLARTARGHIHPESQPDGMAVTAGMGKSWTYRELRLEPRFMVQLRGHKVEPLPGSLLHRQPVPVATTSREINPALILPGN